VDGVRTDKLMIPQRNYCPRVFWFLKSSTCEGFPITSFVCPMCRSYVGCVSRLCHHSGAKALLLLFRRERRKTTHLVSLPGCRLVCRHCFAVLFINLGRLAKLLSQRIEGTRSCWLRLLCSPDFQGKVIGCLSFKPSGLCLKEN
jgi:hypothetical protein